MLRNQHNDEQHAISCMRWFHETCWDHFLGVCSIETLSELGRPYQEAIVCYFTEKSTSQSLEELVMYHQWRSFHHQLNLVRKSWCQIQRNWHLKIRVLIVLTKDVPVMACCVMGFLLETTHHLLAHCNIAKDACWVIVLPWNCQCHISDKWTLKKAWQQTPRWFMKNHTYSMINGIPLLLKIFVNLNHFNNKELVVS